MHDLIEQTLLREGPSTSSNLAAALVAKHGLSPEAARKRLSRRSPEVKSLSFVTFPRNARFIYLQSQFGSMQYWNNLIHALLDTRSAYGLALAALQERQGIMPANQFVIACGSPIRQAKHISAETILQRLKQAGLVGEYNIPGVGHCVALLQGSDRYDDRAEDLHARLVCEDILLKAVKMWVRRLGLGSYDKVTLRGDSDIPPKVGTFAWDLSAPSYAGPMIEWSAKGTPKPGFIVCDVNLASDISEAGIKPFINKCTALRSLKNVGRCLQIYLANNYSLEAFNLCKKHGLIPATPESLFGHEVAAGLSQLTTILSQTARASSDPGLVHEVFTRLGKIEGAANNLRGALFEYIAAEIARQSIGSDIHMNRVFKNATGVKVEVDVVAIVNHRAVHFIECKGYQPVGLVDFDFINTWIEKKIPIVYQEARAHYEWKNYDITFEIWTTGKFSDEALARLKEAQDQIRSTKYTVVQRDAPALLELAKSTRDSRLIDTLKQHFFDHPLATLAVDLDRKKSRLTKTKNTI